MKTIRIIGAGHIGQAIALQLLKINIPVLISNSRGPETLQPVLSKLGNGAKAVSAKEAAEADMVILALCVQWIISLFRPRFWTFLSAETA